jgi:hypothetical protein
MGGKYGPTQIIWTSSSNAKKEAFSTADIQHFRGLILYFFSTPGLA